MKSLWQWFRGWLRGGPHFVIGESARPYMLRWYIIPRNPLCNVYLHKFCRDDDDRALHDHPWPSMSLCLKGRIVEETRTGRRLIGIGSVVFRRATFAHRVELPGGRPAWTLFITGPSVREWGFWCPQGWVHWQDFTAPGKPGETGRGCGEAAG